jgi:hypothetical protein
VRNVAFAGEAKAHFVANPRALPAVVAALDAPDAEVATYASSTLCVPSLPLSLSHRRTAGGSTHLYAWPFPREGRCVGWRP